MEGAALAVKDRFNLAVVTAWHTAVFGLGMYAGKLKGKSLSDFLTRDDDPHAAKHAKAIAYFHKLKARGVPVEITRLN